MCVPLFNTQGCVVFITNSKAALCTMNVRNTRTHIDTRIHTHTNTHVHTLTHTHTHTHTRYISVGSRWRGTTVPLVGGGITGITLVQECASLSFTSQRLLTHTYTPTYIHTHTHTPSLTQTHVHTRTHMHSHIYTQPYKHMYTNTHNHTHTHTHTSALSHTLSLCFSPCTSHILTNANTLTFLSAKSRWVGGSEGTTCSLAWEGYHINHVGTRDLPNTVSTHLNQK